MTIHGPNNFVLIIGAMKSGTTSLFRILSQHPNVAACREKEPEFFSVDANYRHGLQWYLDLWDWDPTQHSIALEASTGYTKAPQRAGVPERIAAVEGRKFRFIYIMRHPFERIESHVRHGLYAGWTRSLDDGMRPQDGIIDTTRYASQINEYLRFFPRESMLFLTLEEFRQDSANVMQRICRHIGIADDFGFQGLNFRANQGARYDAPKFVNRIGDSQSPMLRRIKKSVSKLVKLPHHYQLWRYTPVKLNRGRYKLTDRERDEIREMLRPDLERLRTEYGIDTQKHWQL